MQRFCAAGFAFLVLQQHAEFIAADAVAVAAAGVGFFDAVCDLGKADISLQMAVAVVDLLEVIHIKHHQHPAAAAHLSGAVQVAVLVQKPGQRVQLVPHLAAINIVQHRQQRDAQPCNVQLRQRELDHGLRAQKQGQRVDQHAAAVLKGRRRAHRSHHKVQHGGIVHGHINIEVRAPGVEVFPAHREHQPIGQRCRQKKQIRTLAAHRRLEYTPDDGFFIQHIYQTQRHRRCQSKAKIVGQNIQPAVARRCAVHHDGDDLQHRDARNERKGQKEPALLLFI